MDLRRAISHCFQKTNVKYRNTEWWKIKWLRKIHHTKIININQKKKKKAAAAVITSNKTTLKEKLFLDKEGH